MKNFSRFLDDMEAANSGKGFDQDIKRKKKRPVNAVKQERKAGGKRTAKLNKEMRLAKEHWAWR